MNANHSVAIIGSGPTGIYSLKGLVESAIPLSITMFELEAEIGKGTPYHPDINDQSMLANIASVELPPVCETLVQWLARQSDDDLLRLRINRDQISPREFYPRIVLGEYFESQLHQLLEIALANKHEVKLRPQHRVVDIKLTEDDIQLSAKHLGGEQKVYAFKHVVMATGHDWPEVTEVKPGYFISPWPASALKKIKPCSVGILGTSLSAIDALVTIATAHGTFYFDSGGQLQYQAAEQTDGLHVTLMSRKGVLPEADFYCDYPYLPLQICTAEAVDAAIKQGTNGLLDRVFELFRNELSANDPSYAAKIGLPLLSIETIAQAYFKDRENADPFVWAAANLAEAKQNKANRYTVPWRYAILRMHELIAGAVPHFDDVDLKRFHKHFKALFVDDYATIPHQSIDRLLALRRAGKLDIARLGSKYEIDTSNRVSGAAVRYPDGEKLFDVFVDATGQASLSATDIPFPSLLEQGVVKTALTVERVTIHVDDDGDTFKRTGGIELDAAFRPKFQNNLSNQIYCASIAFLLHKLPFVQGITSAHEIGSIVSKAILDDINPAKSNSLIFD